MNICREFWALSLLTVTLLFTPGCTTVSIRSKQYLGLPTYAPTLPESVKILHEVPVAPQVRLGEITVEPQGNPKTTEIEQKLQRAAAAMGANAVVIVLDQTMVLGATVVGGPWWGGARVVPDTGRVIVAVAIRFTP